MKKILICLFFCVAFCSQDVLAKGSLSEAELTTMLEKLFKERPDLIINVLREHSELVLDIAQEGSTKRRKRNLVTQWREDMKTPKVVNLEDRPVLGPKNAPIKVIEFSDFTCPYCAVAAANVKSLMESYAGKVQLVFKHTPISNNPVAVLASEYVIAAGFQSHDKAWQLYDVCFEKRDQLLAEGEKFLKSESKRIGLDMVKLGNDVKSEKTKKILEQDLADAEKMEVEGTPYFLVNDMVVRGAVPLELFKEAFDLALRKK